MDNEDDSLPYIDDATDDEATNHYNLKIIENYQNKNRNIEITNASPCVTSEKPLGPVAPLADEDELGDFRNENAVDHPLELSPAGMKLVIKSWNSSVSIQGLDNKSSITFRRKPEKKQKRTSRSEERRTKSEDEVRTSEKGKKGRWKVLTRSLMLSKSSRSERRGPEERYPKYVLLKNEEDELPKMKESYPKMFTFRRNENVEPKSEFSFKRSFKNKTKPIVPLEEILKENNPRIESEVVRRQKKQLSERRTPMKKVERRRRSVSVEQLATRGEGKQENAGQCPQGHVFREIQGIIEDTLKLAPPTNVGSFQQEPNCPRGKPMEHCVSPQFCYSSCHDPFCPIGHPSDSIPVHAQRGQAHKNASTRSVPRARETDAGHDESEADLHNLRFGVLSSFFPRVLILKAVQTHSLADEAGGTKSDNPVSPNCETQTEEEEEEYAKPLGTLEVPQQDITMKSKMVEEAAVTDPEVEFYLGNVSKREDVGSDEDQKTKTDESEATEYLHYCEFEPTDNESVERMRISTPPPPPPNNEGKDKNPSTVDKVDEENSKNLSLTKIGYKMYDNLTKLSLNREKEIVEKAEVSGCGCNGNKAKKSPYNITLESNNNVVKVTVPENELNFQIVNSEGSEILIGLTSGETKKGRKEEETKKIVRREELWHADGEKRAVVLGQNQQDERDGAAGSQKLRVSLAENKEVLLSIEMNEKCEKEDKAKPKSTKETKVGTDDSDLAGGDFVCTLGESYKNLSPRTARLLKSLREKLKIGEQERKFLEEKINQKITDQKYESKTLPGLFLVKQISPRPNLYKRPLEIPALRKPKKESEKVNSARQVREYYCEDCLATMRIFEDANPSVKSMVDKFETIIQLESY